MDMDMTWNKNAALNTTSMVSKRILRKEKWHRPTGVMQKAEYNDELSPIQSLL